MNYTLNQLRIFLKIVEKQSITKASEELHLTQPAVSIQLKNFQNQFPIPLTEVVGRQLFITDFGNEIAVIAKRILKEVEGINYKLLTYQGELAGRLKVSVVSTGKYVIPYFLSGFMRENAGVDLVMDVTNKSRVVESLEENQVDFALVSVLPAHLNLNKIGLMKNILHLVGNPKYFEKVKLGKKSFAKDTPLIFREKGSATRAAMENYLTEKSIAVGKKIELTSNEAVKQAVIAGLGCSIMPLIGVNNELERGDLKIIPQKHLPITTTWNLVWLRNKKLSPVASALLDYIDAKKEEIINSNFQWIQRY
ncbi:LysR family transcriptional regulator [Flagellimonas allohymeniacidonis]|uniref:LysR family transcriptional regulator n=1 Tax=Flagellimonas allohymeniacidonis TaxID=2517819 RepID=A0A4Q8QE84_9FLAO|nr:LysR family transcriptional regulator [Allomuricauda hymeniacidonis]TAI47917.1 LysR family transcriptional regulator [Allomuricauda hymeniacidonis]